MVFAFRSQFDDRLVGHALDRPSSRYSRATFLQLLDPLPRAPDFLAQFAVGGFEAAHRAALLLQVGQGFQATTQQNV